MGRTHSFCKLLKIEKKVLQSNDIIGETSIEEIE